MLNEKKNMEADKTFEQYKKEFEEKCFTGDTEGDHNQADGLLTEIALCTNLTTDERKELIEIYESVDKWFA